VVQEEEEVIGSQTRRKKKIGISKGEWMMLNLTLGLWA